MAHRVIYLPLAELLTRVNPANPKDHDIEDIKASIRRHGYTELGLLDDRTGLISAGHGRAEALEEMWAGGEPAPNNVEVDDDGAWVVPVMVDAFASPDDTEARAYLVSSNHPGMKAGFDNDRLAPILEELRTLDRLDGTGFSGDDLDDLLASMGRPGEGEEAPDQSARVVTRYSVVVDVVDDAAQRALIDQLGREGYRCRALNS